MDTLKSKLPPIGQLGPFIALLIACVIFGAHDRALLQRRELLADPAAGDGGRRHRDRPDADHPDRRHRPVVRHGDGAGQHRDDQVRRRPGRAGAAGHPVRHRA